MREWNQPRDHKRAVGQYSKYNALYCQQTAQRMAKRWLAIEEPGKNRDSLSGATVQNHSARPISRPENVSLSVKHATMPVPLTIHCTDTAIMRITLVVFIVLRRRSVQGGASRSHPTLTASTSPARFSCSCDRLATAAGPPLTCRTAKAGRLSSSVK